MSLPRGITTDQLHKLLNQHILKNEETMPYSFFVNDKEIVSSLASTLDNTTSTEDITKIVYQPLALFRVHMVTRCSSSLQGHTEAVLSVAFSPDGTQLATGSGDTTVRLWDILTGTPYAECKGHKNWVLFVSWSPDGKYVASGSMDKTIKIWDKSGKLISTFYGHSQPVTSIAWEPLHRNPQSNRLVSGSKDTLAKVWNVTRGQCDLSLGSHTKSITTVKWGGEGFIYTASQDTTIKVWSDTDGKLVRVLKGHGHWVNTLALNTDYVLRTGAYDHTGIEETDPKKAQEKALDRYKKVKGNRGELLVSGSDDFTCYLWEPSKDKQPIIRMTGHAKLINLVSFSPDGRFIVSASFDKNIKLWNSAGKFLTTFRGHVGEVYQVCWSSDSRMFVSGSKDSTMKVWDSKKLKMLMDLPGHADEVYSVDWSPDGKSVASGSKDRLVKIWSN
uniref:NLE domain-containing protein n=1 Tax=Arcella intermedia TaxID=1963864 RepID=A0A6B2L345_9EUKA